MCHFTCPSNVYPCIKFGVPKHSAANSQKLGAVPSNIQIEMKLPMPFNKSRFMIVVEIVLCYLCMKVKKIYSGAARS